MSKKKVAIIVANGTEQGEFIIIHDILTRANVEINVFAESNQQFIETNFNLKLKLDQTVDELVEILKKDPHHFDMLILPGGEGHQLIDQNKNTDFILKTFFENNKLVAAICAGPIILARRGYLQNKKAVCYSDLQKELVKHGAILEKDAEVVIDMNIIMGQDLYSVFPFSFAVVKQLVGKDFDCRINK